MYSAFIEKSKVHTLSDMVNYDSDTAVTKTIIRKITGNISIVAIDSGEYLTEKISPFDTFIQIIEGVAIVEIDENPFVLLTGQAIIVPAHSSNTIKANKQFKMILTIIKSGYEEV